MSSAWLAEANSHSRLSICVTLIILFCSERDFVLHQVKSLHALLALCLVLHGAIRGDCLFLSHSKTLSVLDGWKGTFWWAGLYVWFKPPAIKAAFRQQHPSVSRGFCPSFCKAASVTHSLSSNGTSSLCLVAAGASTEPVGLLPVRSCWRQGGRHPSLISFRVSVSLFSGTDMLIQTIQSLTMPVKRHSAGCQCWVVACLLPSVRLGLKPLK